MDLCSRLCLAATLDAAAIGRGLVRDACKDWGVPGLVEDAELVVTELVDNVVLHVGGTVDLLLVVRERYLHVEVHDGDPARPERTLPDATGEGGRGLLLIDATAARWGSVEVADGKIVWADLPIPRGNQPG